MQLDAILAVLDEQGRAAFRLVAEQIERARADRRLAFPDTECYRRAKGSELLEKVVT